MVVMKIKIQSKLKTTYITLLQASYLSGADWRVLDPIFSGRLAYAAKDNNIVLHITEGFRSPERQKELYAMYQEYLRTGKGSIKLAAKPGTSRHEYRLAIDTSTQPIRGMNNSQLAKYGLCKPIASEPWHIEPIELMGKNINQIKASYLPVVIKESERDLTKEETINLFNELMETVRPVYKMPNDLPEWAKEPIKKMIKDGHIAPNEKDGSINMSEDLVRTLAIMDRRLK